MTFIFGPAQLYLFDPEPEIIIAGGPVWKSLGELTPMMWTVEYCPGPPAVGGLRKKDVNAGSADEAHDIIKGQHNWVMIHKVYRKRGEDGR